MICISLFENISSRIIEYNVSIYQFVLIFIIRVDYNRLFFFIKKKKQN